MKKLLLKTFCAIGVMIFSAGNAVNAQNAINGASTSAQQTIQPLGFVPDKYRSTVITGLPAGAVVSGLAEPPKAAGDGSFFQIVDLDALQNSELQVNYGQGLIGEQKFFVKAFYEEDVSTIPLDITLDPWVDNGLVRISGFDSGARLLDSQGNEIALTNIDSLLTVELPYNEVDGLMVDVSKSWNNFDLQVKLNSFFEGSPVVKIEDVPIDVAVKLQTYSEERSHYIKPTNDSLLFAQSGSVQFDSNATERDVSIRATNGRYLVVDGSKVYASSDRIDSLETFKLINLQGRNDGNFALQDSSGKYLSAYSKNQRGFQMGLYADVSFLNYAAQFKIIEHDNGEVSFRAIYGDGYYLGLENGGDSWIRARFNSQDDSAKFTLIDRTNTSTPLDIIVNPKIDNGTVRIAIFDSGARLLDSQGNEITLSDEGSFQLVTLPYNEVKGLMVDVSQSTSDFTLQVVLNSYLDGRPAGAFQYVFIDSPNFSETANGEKQLLIDGLREEYDVERVSNSLVITKKNRPEKVVRVDMVQVKHIRFSDAIVSSADYYKTIDISQVTDNLIDNPNNIIVIEGVSKGTIINNAIPLGEGAFAIPASDVSNWINIDYSTVHADYSEELTVKAYTVTNEQKAILDGSGRVSGYANAEVMASAGFNTAMEVGPDGLRGEVKAYAEARAVATAGGEVRVDGVGVISGSVEAEAVVYAEVEAKIIVSKNELVTKAAAGTEANVTITADVKVTIDFIPGTESHSTGKVGTTTYAKVEYINEVAYGDGKYGVDSYAEASAGIMVGAEGTSCNSVGGVGGCGTGGVSAGLGVGAGGGGVAMYDNGEITFGASGELALVIGVEFDFTVKIDTNDVADTGKLLGKGVITGVEAVDDFGMDAGVAIRDFGLDVGYALRNRLITGVEAVDDFGMDAGVAIRDFGLNVGY
ncbi:MAG: hypothetical protein GY696_22870, partial [Gammaproteobacteria bacterium]|nr:hypothetical protein [Gammaproteobacteria bacterium]